MILISSWSRLCPTLWSQVLSREWRCSWSSADRRCSNYIWVIDNLIAHKGASYIRDLTVLKWMHSILSQNDCGAVAILKQYYMHFDIRNVFRNAYAVLMRDSTALSSWRYLDITTKAVQCKIKVAVLALQMVFFLNQNDSDANQRSTTALWQICRSRYGILNIPKHLLVFCDSAA